MNKSASSSISTWQILAAIVSVLIAVAVLTVQWQATADQLIVLEKGMIEVQREVKVDRDEQAVWNREQRDAVASLKSRVAVLEARYDD
jgi:hypothetical protein